MITTKFNIPLYDVKVTFIFIESKKDKDSLEKILKNTILEQKDIKRALDIVKGDFVNGGDTFRDLGKRQMLCIIYRCTSLKVLHNVVSHEKRHIEDRILEYFSVDDKESSALLSGFLATKIYGNRIFGGKTF